MFDLQLFLGFVTCGKCLHFKEDSEEKDKEIDNLASAFGTLRHHHKGVMKHLLCKGGVKNISTN